MLEENKFFLLDSYALIFRAYYAFINNPMRNAEGMNTSALFGFTLALDEIIRKENPSHIIAAFDASGPTFRHEMYEPYKANRDATPEEVKEAIPWVKKLLAAYKVPVIELAGYEADDIIGTIAKKAESEGFKVYMVTPDKDFAQLVSENIYMYKPGRSGNPPEILDIKAVRDKFDIETPLQVIDILALWGDASDNIPGAPGIGEKTSKKLISSYHSVEGVYDCIEELKGKQKENLLHAKDQVELSKKLATIVTDVPVAFDLNSSKRNPINKSALIEIFNEMNFNNLKQRILGNDDKISNNKSEDQSTLFDVKGESEESHDSKHDTVESVQHNYSLLTSTKELESFINKLKSTKTFCFDTETTGLDVISAELVGISFSYKAHEAYYFHLSEQDEERKKQISLIAGAFADPDKRIIGQNLKYDLHILKNCGLDLPCNLFDTMVAHSILYQERKHGLDAMALDLLSYEKIKTESLIGKKGAPQLNFKDLDVERIKEYACEDADITWQLYLMLEKELKERKLENLANNIEMPLVKVLMEMEHNGVSLDVNSLKDFANELRKDLINIEANIYKLAGEEFNINSPKQLGIILFEKLKIDSSAKKTKSKQYSTNEDILIRLTDRHEIVGKVLEYRSLKKLLSTYVEALPKMIHKETGKIHTSFNQTLVATGRLSSNNPNLQNIPIREERGRAIRKAFTSSSKEHRFLSADYSQIELRLMAHLSNDRNMIEAFINNEDIHTSTAAKVYNIDIKDVTREMRSKAKTANFGIIYGISAFGLAQRMHISRTEAKELIDGYFSTYPAVRHYMDECISKAREMGYVETMFGRRRLLPDIVSRNSIVRGNAERNAINTPIQGTAADIIKIAMVRIQEKFVNHKMKAEMVIQVHDELNFNVPVKELQQAKDIVKESMETAVNLNVPLLVDMNSGMNWLEAH